MSEQQSSYRQIMKATSLFGGVQVITILIGIIKTKFTAVWLGTAGVGIIGLLSNPLSIITTITGLGISFSAVREIANAASSNNELQIANTIKTFRRWVWFTGILGLSISIIFAYLLSNWTFGNSNYTWSFILLSITLLLNDLSAGQKALLQGLRRLKDMAQSTIIGAVLGLLTSLPLYYYFGLKGIVPSLIFTSIFSLIISWFYSRRIKVKQTNISYKESFVNGLSMIKLGVVLTLSGLIGTVIRYIISAYISRTGGVDQVGLYQAGFYLITGYVGIIFSAMGTDYFPRLSGTKNNKDSIELINQQIEIALLILAPICIALTIGLPIVVRLLYSKSFIATIPMLEWVLISTVIKSIVWAIGYFYLAKGDFVTSFKVDNITNLFLLIGYIVMYKFMGLEGIGIAELILYCFGLLLTYYYAHKKYNFIFHKTTAKIATLGIVASFIIFIVLRIMQRSLLAYIISLLFWCVLFIISYRLLDKRLNIKDIFIKLANR